MHFARMRFRVFALLVLNLVVVASVLAFVGARALALEVWYLPAFPSNLLMVVNEGDALDDVVVLLDHRYRFVTESMPPGLNGFEIERRFLDEDGNRPTAGYRPRLVTVRAAGRTMDVVVESRGP